jgi:RimJ/RimL family protein N-acetyltransferase
MMFARTARLLLRPGFPEDAPALARAIGDKAIARNLAVVPWPYTLRDAEAFLASPRDPILPSLLIFERGTGAPQLIGSCGLARRPSPRRRASCRRSGYRPRAGATTAGDDRACAGSYGGASS